MVCFRCVALFGLLLLFLSREPNIAKHSRLLLARYRTKPSLGLRANLLNFCSRPCGSDVHVVTCHLRSVCTLLKSPQTRKRDSSRHWGRYLKGRGHGARNCSEFTTIAKKNFTGTERKPSSLSTNARSCIQGLCAKHERWLISGWYVGHFSFTILDVIRWKAFTPLSS